MIRNGHGTIFVLIVIFILSERQTLSQQTQYLMLWSGPTCTGDPFRIPRESGSYPLPQSSLTTLSIRTNGLWSIELCVDGTDECRQRSIQSGTGGIGCSSIPISSPYNIVRVTMFGNSLQDERKIHFFTEFNFQGEEKVVEDEDDFTPIIARSYYFTGVNTWEYRSDFASAPSCLNFLPAVGVAEYGFTFHLTSNIEVGYVRHDCSSTPPTNTTTTTTTPFTGSTPPTTPRITGSTTTSTGPTVQPTTIPIATSTRFYWNSSNSISHIERKWTWLLVITSMFAYSTLWLSNPVHI